MKDKAILFGASIESLSTRKDKTVSIRIGTQELSPQLAGELYRLQNAFVYVALKEEDFGREEIEALESHEAEILDDHRKTQSQRLRSVLFLRWKQDSKGHKTFAVYYAAQLKAKPLDVWDMQNMFSERINELVKKGQLLQPELAETNDDLDF